MANKKIQKDREKEKKIEQNEEEKKKRIQKTKSNGEI